MIGLSCDFVRSVMCHCSASKPSSAGVHVEEGPDRDNLTEKLAEEDYVPVYLDQRTVDLHYNGFCNTVLWQLFHYVPLNSDSKLSETRQVPRPRKKNPLCPCTLFTWVLVYCMKLMAWLRYAP